MLNIKNEEKNRLEKYYNDYIEGVTVDNIEFKILTYDELQSFFKGIIVII